MAESHKRTLVKALIWRAFNLVYWPVIGYIVTGSWVQVGYLSIAAIIGFVLYYGYERLWNNIKWEKT